MTLMMLPPAPKDVGRLSDVFASALGAIVGGELNRLKLPRVQSAIVVLIDGLGYQNLKDHLGHARNLAALFKNSSEQAIRCGFPSTTAVSLTSLGTGLRAGSHGILGYQIRDANGSVRNMLNSWRESDDVRLWQANRTVAETAATIGVIPKMVAAPEFEGSGFTNIIMGELEFHGHVDLGERVQKAHRLASEKNSLIYLYFAELDQAAHRFGVDSVQWRQTLESIDASIASLAGNYGVLITADHGIVDVPAENHVYLDAVSGFTEAVGLAVGDPRALYCYGDKQLAMAALESNGISCYVTDFDELIERGWVSAKISVDQLPDFVLVARGNIAFYDRRTAKPQSLKMVGQHGSISDEEMRIPLIRGGGFA